MSWKFGCGRIPWLTFVLLCGVVAGVPAAAQTVDYDVVYVRQPRYGDTQNTEWPEVFHPAKMDPGADLMLLHPDGSEEVLFEGGEGSVTDPFLSFDAKWVYFSYFYNPAVRSSHWFRLPIEGADIFRIHLETREIEQLTDGEFTPNTGAGNWDESKPVNPGPGFNSQGHGIFNLGACPLPGGKIIFTSSRNAFRAPRNFTSPVMQLYVMDEDGGNVTQIAPMTIGSALHPVVLRDGRVAFSTYEAQGVRDERLWGLWTIYPDGRHWEPLISAFRSPQSFHFMTQMDDEDVVVVDYYNLNNNGFGALERLPVRSPDGGPRFYPADVDQNPQIDQTVGGGFSWPYRMPFTPKGMRSITPFTHGVDEAAPVGAGGVRVGKFTHPSAGPDGDLLTVWTPGPANDLNRPTPDPRYDAGLYVIPDGRVIHGPDELVLIKNDPNYNEAWPRAVVPYSAVHGVSEPAELPWLPNDGSLHRDLPEGTPYGIVGTSSFYKRESAPGYVRPGQDHFDGLDAFNTAENRQSSNWSFQGADAGLYSNSEIWAVRVLAMEPNTDRGHGPNWGQHFYSHANERLRILGEILLRKGPEGSPVRDAEGNPDTSFLAKIPADTPFTFQTIDRDGLALNVSQTWHQVRPGEVRSDCGGCHAHSQTPLEIAQTAAGASSYEPINLVGRTPILTRDAQGKPAVRTVQEGVVDVEFFRDIRPLLTRSCVPCHQGPEADAPGHLTLSDHSYSASLPNDYRRLADDPNAEWGHKPLVRVGGQPRWRQTNASRYIRKFQSRRSLLMWKIFGRRLDGWSNSDHPTETQPGNVNTLPGGSSAVNKADLDFTGTQMPPPGSGIPGLTSDEKMTFARWIDLGCPIDRGQGGGPSDYGWFLDDLRPTLAVSAPRAGLNLRPVDSIRIGLADANSGVDMSAFSVKASFAVAGRTPGTELADLAQATADGVWTIPLGQPLRMGLEGELNVEVADRQGNVTRVKRSFRTVPLPSVVVDPESGRAVPARARHN